MAPTIRELLHELLRNWQDEAYHTPLCQLYQFRALHSSNPSALQHAVRETIQALIQELALHHPTQAQILQLRFWADQSVAKVAQQLAIAEQTLYKFQAMGIDWIAGRLEEQERAARTQLERRFRLRLEASTNPMLFGVDAHMVKLVKLLSDEESPWLIALEGVGGIGKTALAQVLMEHMIGLSNYEDFAWVTARHTRLDLNGSLRQRPQPALTTEALVDRLVAQLSEQDSSLCSLIFERKLGWLQERLKETPHLIVVDNLETVLDLETLLPLLQRICNPSRFLLTSRSGLGGESNIYHFRVPLLSEEDALQLMRNEIELRHFPGILDSSDTVLRPIFETVGGNPLALRLVIGLLDVDTIDNILNDLHEGQGDAVENLYTYIYRHAYTLLNKTSRQVWLSLALVVAPLATVDLLAKVNQQQPHEVRNALHTLARMNLVDVHGDLMLRTYSIHPLTRTFLEKEIGKWDRGDQDEPA
ncbi:MAG: NB-ARC domain-containing protein [Caldilineaceae bacterium]